MIKNSELFEITKIEVQKKNKNRVSVFISDEFAFGVDQDILIAFGLYKGVKLTQEQIDDIRLADNKKCAKDRALRFLSYRDRSEKEIHDKLVTLGYDEKVVAWVITELQRLMFVDDRRFAVAFAKNKMLSRPCGEFMLRSELKRKGIHDDLIDMAIDEVFSQKDQANIALELAEKKILQKRDCTDKLKLKKQINDLLLRRGFSYDIVRYVLENVEL
ncbi:RecX family transcriptional regulator [candidate division KSB1 bacterium]|nr:RecX family transcriptional regulator [candidate division KSB1 bacterium]